MVFARLKSHIETGQYILGELMYPKRENYTIFPDHCYNELLKDERVDVLTFDEYNNRNIKQEDKINEIVNSQWKKAEKEIKTINDIELLNKMLNRAKELNKNKIIEILNNRVEELKY